MTDGKRLARRRKDEDELADVEVMPGNLAASIRGIRVGIADMTYADVAALALDLALDFDSGGGDVYKGKLQLESIRLVLDAKKEQDRPLTGGESEDDFANWKAKARGE